METVKIHALPAFDEREATSTLPAIVRMDGEPENRKWRIVEFQPFEGNNTSMWIAVYSEAVPKNVCYTEGDGEYAFEHENEHLNANQ